MITTDSRAAKRPKPETLGDGHRGSAVSCNHLDRVSLRAAHYNRRVYCNRRLRLFPQSNKIQKSDTMMMGSCTAFGMFFGILGMLTPLIAIGAIIYLVVAKRTKPNPSGAH
jgi:hypothetical protein